MPQFCFSSGCFFVAKQASAVYMSIGLLGAVAWRNFISSPLGFEAMGKDLKFASSFDSAILFCAVSWQDQRFFNERKTSANKKGWIKCVTKWREYQLPAELKNQWDYSLNVLVHKQVEASSFSDASAVCLASKKCGAISLVIHCRKGCELLRNEC